MTPEETAALLASSKRYTGYIWRDATNSDTQRRVKVAAVAIGPDCIATAAHPLKDAKEGQEIKARCMAKFGVDNAFWLGAWRPSPLSLSG